MPGPHGIASLLYIEVVDGNFGFLGNRIEMIYIYIHLIDDFILFTQEYQNLCPVRKVGHIGIGIELPIHISVIRQNSHRLSITKCISNILPHNGHIFILLRLTGDAAETYQRETPK